MSDRIKLEMNCKNNFKNSEICVQTVSEKLYLFVNKKRQRLLSVDENRERYTRGLIHNVHCWKIYNGKAPLNEIILCSQSDVESIFSTAANSKGLALNV